MAIAAKKTVTTSKAASAQPINMTRGILFALLAIPIGIILWVILWRWGFMASIVSFVIAWLAVFLYTLGSKADVSKKAAPYLLGVIVLGIILSFIGGMASDAAEYFIQDTDMTVTDALASSDYWAFLANNLFSNAELWGSYITDILIALAFGLLGSFGILKSLFTPEPTTTAKAK